MHFGGAQSASQRIAKKLPTNEMTEMTDRSLGVSKI